MHSIEIPSFVLLGIVIVKLFLMPRHVIYPAINVKISTSTGKINTTSEGFKPRRVFICLHLTLYEKLKFHAQLN